MCMQKENITTINSLKLSSFFDINTDLLSQIYQMFQLDIEVLYISKPLKQYNLLKKTKTINGWNLIICYKKLWIVLTGNRKIGVSNWYSSTV